MVRAQESATGGAKAKAGLSGGKIFLLGVAATVTVVAVLAALGMVPVLSALMGTMKPRDLGTNPGKAAFESAMKKAKVKAVWPGATPIPLNSATVSGRQPLDAEFTDDEIAALMNAFYAGYPVTGVQVAFHAGNRAEASGNVAYSGRNWPGYISGELAFTGGRVEPVGTPAVQAAGAPVPGQWRGQAQDAAVDYFNRYLDVPGLTISRVELAEGLVRVKGTVPRSIAP